MSITSLSLEEQLIFHYFKIVGLSEVTETENLLRDILRNSAGNGGENQKSLNECIATINGVLKSYNFEIAEAVDDFTSKKVHCLISTGTSMVVQKATFYNKPTCELLSKIIQECTAAENGCISENACLNLAISVKNNKATMEDCMDRLIKDKWIVSMNGKISLGVRCQLELEVPIKKHYPDQVKHCSLCKVFLVQGFTCVFCRSHIHFRCLKKYHESCNLPATSKICPMCKKESNEVEDVEMESCGEEDQAEAELPEEPPVKRSRTSM